MTKKGTQLCPVLRSYTQIFYFLFFTSLSLCGGNELELLLSFKDKIKDPSGYLSGWNGSNPTATICLWNGITCDTSSHVTTIKLAGKNLTGKNIPTSIFQLPYIQTINLAGNQFTGEIPNDVFSSSSSSLRFLNLSNNNFTGKVPPVHSVSKLETLDLSNNMLSGPIPVDIGSFSSLKYLDLGGNVLVGEIPTSISEISSLESLTLASNQLSGPIPGELAKLKSLKWIYIGYNNLSGQIPSEIGELTSLNHLDFVYNNLTGEIPSSFGNLTNLQYLFLYNNKLSGPIPKSVFGLKNLVSLDLSDNSLTGEIPEMIIQLQNLEILHLFSNKFSGKIPNGLTFLPRLQVLQLWSNRFSGEIPGDLGIRNNLTILDLSTNNLTGKVPEGVCNSKSLFKLMLFSNSLSGVLPKSLGECKSLRRVRIQNNGISGELPPGFTEMPLVYYLDMSSNGFIGNVGEREWNMPALQMLDLGRNGFSGNLPDLFRSNKVENLDLSENGFSGAIPRSIGKLSEMVQLNLHGNKLSGVIPAEISSCKKLVSLDLSHNHLSGQIPATISEMPVLGQLDLSENRLSGEIPANLGNMASLVQVNVSHNHLHGKLPNTGAFLAINGTAVNGNGLCGGDDVTGLPRCNRSVQNKPVWLYPVACSVAVLVVVLVFSVALVFTLFRRRNKSELKRVENEDGIWEFEFFDSKFSKSVSIDDILLSTKEENVISRGKNGVSYKGEASRSRNNVVQFVVKEIYNVGSIPTDFWLGIAESGKLIQHPNIVKLLGMCRYNKGAYLVYEYIEGRKLSEILCSLSWERRRKVGVGIAKALKFLHCYCSPSVLVGDMSSGKVFVDGNGAPYLKLSLPSPISKDTKLYISSTSVAPEIRDNKELTEKSDVYSFGVILIELLTGKSPADVEFGVHQSLVEWARYCYSDCHLDVWVDPTIKGDTSNYNEKEIVETMNLALHCTAGDPTARPCAGDVLKAVEAAFRSRSWVWSLKISSPF